MFVSLDERTYQVLGYTPAAKLASYGPTLRATLNSFARLTDPQALARQPPRLVIVQIPRAMNLDKFNTAYPSVIPIEELALINQLGGPQATMPAGFRAKRVVDEQGR